MKFNGVKILVIATFICVFMFPTYYIKNISGIDADDFFFLGMTLLVYIGTIATSKQITRIELFSLLLIIIICIFKHSVAPLYLIELMLAYRFSDCLSEGKIIKVKGLSYLCIFFVLIYSMLYFGYDGRYIYTGLREINQSGFAILMLFLIIRYYNKKIGNILLLTGLLTFSRNYLLCLIIFLILEKIKTTNFFQKIYHVLTFKNLMLVSFFFLLALSISFEIAYKNNRLSEYQNGINKYLNLYDYSNYFRFSVNTKLLKIYKNHPQYLLTGIDDEQFYQYSLEISKQEQLPYRQIKPHNYFFSYLRIYGIFATLIFIILEKIVSKIANINNISILIVIFVYANILGIGLANYWLYLSLITMNVYKERKYKYESE